MRRRPAGDEAHLLQTALFQRFLRQAQMPVMNGIERAAENADGSVAQGSTNPMRTTETQRHREKRNTRIFANPSLLLGKSKSRGEFLVVNSVPLCLCGEGFCLQRQATHVG